MKTLSILSQKGGTGKTTIAVNLSVAGQMAGEKTALVDLDDQASAMIWWDLREDKNAPVAISAHAIRLPQILHELKRDGITLAILDTKGKQDPSIINIAEASDMALIPCRESVLDISAIQSTISAGENAQTPMRILFNAIKPRSATFYQSKKAVMGYDVPITPIALTDLNAFSRSLLDGESVLEFEPDGKAAREIRALYQYVAKEMGV